MKNNKWKYSNEGYVTTVIDNSCLDWSTRYLGVLSKVDHQFVAPFCLDDSHPFVDPHGNFRGPFSIRRRCMHGKYVHSYAFDYLEQFWKNYDSQSKFSLVMLNEGHESTGEVIGLVDDDLYLMLNRQYKDNLLDNTAIIFLSDHGLHMGVYYMLNTYSGRLENKLPLLDIVLPTKFLKEYPEVEQNLKLNEQKLVTGPDIYETLEHLMQYPKKSIKVYNGESLLTNIPSRDCDSAKINHEFCACK